MRSYRTMTILSYDPLRLPSNVYFYVVLFKICQ